MRISQIIPSPLKSWISARTLANTSKRLDICAAQFAMIFYLGNTGDLKNKVCLEIGSGRVLSHAIICHLLGAKHVYATDILPIANPKFLKIAVRNAIPSVVRDMLGPFGNHDEIRQRLNTLLEVKNFSFETLEELGIEYIAPIDFASDEFHHNVDFIYSNAVLEHIPSDDILPVLKNLTNVLSPNGDMIHSIHLEDHNHIGVKPFAFLSEPDINYSRDTQTSRGNRIRKSQWLNIIKNFDDLDCKLLYEFRRNDIQLPHMISPSICYIDENDLRVTHLGLLLSKKSS